MDQIKHLGSLARQSLSYRGRKYFSGLWIGMVVGVFIGFTLADRLTDEAVSQALFQAVIDLPPTWGTVVFVGFYPGIIVLMMVGNWILGKPQKDPKVQAPHEWGKLDIAFAALSIILLIFLAWFIW